MIERNRIIQFLRKFFSIFLKVLIPFIAIFSGIFLWLEGFKFFFEDNIIRINVFEFSYFAFWFITICFLFKKFISIDLLSKLLVILFISSISIEYWVLLYYNHFSDFCLFFIPYYTPLDVFIIALASFLPSLEALIFVISIFNSRIQSRVAHLTNITHIKESNASKISKLFEIWTSFPVFIGIYHVFILLHEYLILKWCYYLSSNIMISIALPWIILMVFYTVYSIVIILKKPSYPEKSL